MSLTERIEALRARHADLDHRLEEETHRPMPCSEEVSRLKKAKLRVKDELQKLSLTSETV